jgi:streptogramin lyase
VEPLEERRLLAPITEFSSGITASSSPAGIALGADGNLWFTEANHNALGRITPNGTVTEFSLGSTFGDAQDITSGPNGLLYFISVSRVGSINPLAGSTSAILGSLKQSAAVASGASHITAGPDGNLWFTDLLANAVDRITPNLATNTKFPLTTFQAHPEGIAAGPDGALWFTESSAGKIGRITTAGSITEFPLTGGTGPEGITAGPDGSLWFAEFGAGQIGQITTAGTVTEFPLASGAGPEGITAGPDGALWFTENSLDQVGRVSTAGAVTEYGTGITSGSAPDGIVTGPDGNLWFTENAGNRIGQLVPDGPLNATAVSPISVVVGTAFSGPVASFTDGDAKAVPADFLVTITWGDGAGGAGTVTAVSGQPGHFTVSGSHTYTRVGIDQINVVIQDINTTTSVGGSTATVTDSATVLVPTTTAVTSSPNPSSAGQSVTFTATVSRSGPGTPTGMVTFTDQSTNTTLGTATLDLSARASFTAPILAAGSHTIVASYGGDGKFAASSGTLNHQIVNPDGSSTALAVSVKSSVFGQSVTFTATLTASAPGSGTPTGGVDFKDTTTGTDLGTVTLVSGAASLNTAALAVGMHTISASYGGDSNFHASTASADLMVNPDASTTTLTSSLNPSMVGNAVTFTATVTASAPGAGTPTGTVTFMDQTTGTPLGTAALNPQGDTATVSTAGLAAGSHTIVATYGGDANFAAGSGTLTQAVNGSSAATSTTALSASANPAVSGQPVTLTAIVSPAAGSGSTPTGTVTFQLDGNVLGSSPLAPAQGNAAATSFVIPASQLSVGSHAVNAAYQGDANFLASSAGLTLTVGQPPAFTSAAGTTFTVGTAGSFAVAASGSPAPTLSESAADALPAGVSFNAGTGVLSGTPAANSGGTYTLHFRADNGVGSDPIQTFTLTVDQAPAITSAASATFTTGSAGSFTVLATGFPAPALSESSGESPPGGVSFNAATGVLSGTPAAGGTYTLHFAAGNGVGAGASQTFTLTVNQAPAFTSAASAAFTVGAAGSFTVAATGFPAPALSENANDALPAGVTFDPTHGLLSGTPSAGSAGTYTLHFAAANGIGTGASQTFTLSVDQAPAFTSANGAGFAVGAAGTFTVAASGFPAPSLSESPNDSLPTGVSFNAATDLLSGTPAAGSGGSYTLHFTANNGVGTAATQTFTLTVSESPTFTSAAGSTFTAGTAGSFPITARGFPSPTLSESSGDVLPGGVSFDPATDLLAGTPAAGSGGSYTLHFTARNSAGSTSQTFTLTVDQSPAFTSPAGTSFALGAAGSFTVTAGGFPAPNLSEDTGDSLPAGVSFKAATGLLSGTPAANTNGTYTLHFTAHNGVGNDATQTFTLTVNATGQAPAFTSAAGTAFTVGTAGQFTVTATGSPVPVLSVNPNDSLPAGVTFDAGHGLLAGTPAAGSAGTYTLHFTASNGISPDATQTFTFTVNPAGQAPAFTSANAASFAVGAAGNFTVVATGSPTPTLSEVSGDTLPGGVTFDALTGLLSGTPVAGSGGSYTLHFTAHNGVGSDATQTFTLTVDEAPTFTSAAGTAFTAGTAAGFTLSAAGFPAPMLSENGGDTLPAGVSFNAATRVLGGTPGANTGGTYTLHFAAGNSAGSASQTFTLTVNQAPAFTSAAATTFSVGAAGTFSVTAAGFPAATLSESGGDTLPGGVSFSPSTGVLGGTPAAGTTGTYTLHFTADNGVGSAATQTFTLTVGVAPAFTSATSTAFTEGTPGTFTVTATGSPPPALGERTGDMLPGGVTFDPSTGVLAGTPTAGSAGTYTLHLTAANGASPDAAQTFTLTVNPAGQAPVFTSRTSVTFTVGGTGNSFLVAATGSPPPTLSESPRDPSLPAGVSFDAGTGLLSGTPMPGSGGSYTLHFTASNSIGSAAQTFTLNINEAPAFTTGNGFTFMVGTPGGTYVFAQGFPVPTLSESPDDSLPPDLQFNPAVGMIGAAAQGLLSGDAAAGTGGTYTLHFTASNSLGSASQSYRLRVEQTPAFTSANGVTFTAGSPGALQVAASGFPAPTLTESGILPAGVAFDPATGVLSGTPAPGSSGTYPVTFTAHNGVGNDATQAFALTVIAPVPPVPPPITGPLNLAGLVSVSVGPLAPVGKRRKTGGSFTQTVTVTNNGSRAIEGPIVLVLDSLAPRKKVRKKFVPQVIVAGAGGTTQAVSPGSPFVPGPALLPAGGTFSFRLVFQRKGSGTITFNPVLLAGYAQP